MLYYQFALPRIAFLTAPLAYLLFNLNIIHSSASLICLCAAASVPRDLRQLAHERALSLQLLGEIYDLVLAFHLVLPTVVTMFSRNAANST
jgi:cellulose synthase (UDP-forming)